MVQLWRSIHPIIRTRRTAHTHLITRIIQADIDMSDIIVEFDEELHSIDVLNAAAYRLIGAASCQIERAGSKYICRLIPTSKTSAPDALRCRFIDYVTDECLRERLSTKTEAVRNLILSLAFGTLAAETADRV
jgi:His-Xaa-Ser system protein HxsD